MTDITFTKEELLDLRDDVAAYIHMDQIDTELHLQFLEKIARLLFEYEINKDGPDITFAGIPSFWYKGKRPSVYQNEMDKATKKILELNEQMPVSVRSQIIEAIELINIARTQKIDDTKRMLDEVKGRTLRTKEDLHSAIMHLAKAYGAKPKHIDIKHLIENLT